MTLTLKQAEEMMRKNSGNLYLGGCTSLESLPENLAVGESLDLGVCTSLKSLPDNLTVGGSLDLGGCTSLKSPKIKQLKDGGFSHPPRARHNP